MKPQHNRIDLDEVLKLKDENSPLLIERGEYGYHHQVREMARAVRKKGVRLILLTGPSSSGKTTTSNYLSAYFIDHGYNVVPVALDDFYLNSEDVPKTPEGKPDLETVHALDIEAFRKFISELFFKGTATSPKFDFHSSSRKPVGRDISIDDNSIVVVEGIHAHNPLMMFENEHIETFKGYICVFSDYFRGDTLAVPAQDVRLMRRIVRDNSFRNSTAVRTLLMWPDVIAGEDIYIKPNIEQADFIIDSTYNYELLLYKTYLEPVLEKVPSKSETFDKAQQLIGYLKNLPGLTKDVISETSLMREFIEF